MTKVPLRLRAVVLLGGTVASSALTRYIQRATVDLPADRSHSLLDIWRLELAAVVSALGDRPLPIRLLLDRTGPEPRPTPDLAKVTVSVERDPTELRGTAGLLKDISREYDSNDWLLVGNATQIPLEPLHDLIVDLAANAGDLVLAAAGDGSPSGLFLLRCGVLDAVPDVGFVDLKEQALPKIAREHEVRVLRTQLPTAPPAHSRRNYLEAVRLLHRRQAGEPTSRAPFEEIWPGTFSIAEEGSEVHPTAHVHDSVILRGAVVGRDAVVARSVICPGCVVGRRAEVVDQVMHSE